MRTDSDWRTTALRWTLAAAAAVGALGLLSAGSETSAGWTGQEKPNRYIGAGKCKSCHQAKARGNQYGVWSEMKHAQAFEILASEQARKYGAARGVADPQKSKECLSCHTTAFGKPKEHIRKGFKPELGVQCESCHGPGEKHLKARFAAAGAAGADEADAKPQYVVVPEDEIVRQPKMETCLGCHNDKSPSFAPFCFHERSAKIRHLNPLRPRTAAELQAIQMCGCGTDCSCVTGCEEGKCGVPCEAKGSGQ